MNLENSFAFKKWGLRGASTILGMTGVASGVVAVDSAVDNRFKEAAEAGVSAVVLELGAILCVNAPLFSKRKR